MEYLKVSLLGYFVAATLQWGDIGKAFLLGFAGAAGGLVMKILYDVTKKYIVIPSWERLRLWQQKRNN